MLEKIPFEVQKVWAYQNLNQPIGLELYKEIEVTIEKYPQYFKWEHTYRSIPKEVHSKYLEGERNLFLSFYSPKESDIQPGEGMYSWLRRQEPVPSKITNEDLNKAFHYMFVESPKIKKQYETEKRKLWNKYYKKYNLRYRE